MDFASVPLTETLEALASGRPEPGGGAGAAIGGAVGASLVAMMARASGKKAEFARHAKLLEAVAEGADDSRRRLLELAGRDTDAYAAVVSAYGLPDETEEQKNERARAIQVALREAVEVPLQVMEQSLEVIGLAKNTVEVGNRNAAADAATGTELCRAALKGAAFLVKSNLQAMTDEAFVRLSRTRMDEMLYMGTRVATNVESFVEDLWK